MANIVEHLVDINEGDITCPLCHNAINSELLTELELTQEDLGLISRHVDKKTLIPTLQLGEIAAQHLQPETFGTEVQVNAALSKLSEAARKLMESQKETLEELTKNEKADKNEILKEAKEEQNQIVERYEKEIKEIQDKVREEIQDIRQHLMTIKERIAGPGIGRLTELGTITDLKAAVPSDEFDWKGPAGKGDIVGVVMYNGNGAGKIVISRKQEKNWSGNFISQLKRNMSDENTRWGILSTESFPADALNDKVYLHNSGVVIVKPEFTGIAYIAMREAVIQWAEAKSWLDGKMSEVEYGEYVSKVLNDWVSGDKFQKFLDEIEKAEKASQNTDEIVMQLQTYVRQRGKKALDLQRELRGHLLVCSSFLEDLRKELKTIK